MSDKIRHLVTETAAFVEQADERDIAIRWSLVAFGDIRVTGDKIVRYPFTDKVATFLGSLQAMPRFSGGANRGETSLDALATVAQLRGWRANAVHVCLLFTDEEAVGLHHSLEDVGRQLRAQRIATFCVAVDDPAYRWLAEVTGGEWWDIHSERQFDVILRHLAGRVADVVEQHWPRLAAAHPPSPH